MICVNHHENIANQFLNENLSNHCIGIGFLSLFKAGLHG